MTFTNSHPLHAQMTFTNEKIYVLFQKQNNHHLIRLKGQSSSNEPSIRIQIITKIYKGFVTANYDNDLIVSKSTLV